MQPIEIRREDVDATRRLLADRVARTPVLRWSSPTLARLVPGGEAHLKLELLQHTGTFKVRGALAVMLHLDPGQLARGVTAVSAGNHAIAVAWAARQLGTTAKVAMLRRANPLRVALCRAEGGELELVDDARQGFAWCERLVREEGRALVHPFEGMRTSLGTATLGAELCEQVPDLDAVIVPIGGGGLASGVAAAVKLWNTRCAVYGVEPEGAPTLSESLRQGRPATLERIDTIADSLAAPFTGPTSFALCRRHLDDVVLVSDGQLRDAQALLWREARLAVEPAGAAATAALCGPLRERLAGKRTGILVCGSNIDPDSLAGQIRDRVLP